jgi:hypothetical protein
MVELMRPQDLKKLSTDADMAKAQEYLKKSKKLEEEQKALREAFMERDIHAQVKDRVNAAVRRAAENGQHELQIITFPASYCNDSGRRINNKEADWPDSLEGFAKKAYEYYVNELRPLGYKVRVEILDYPGGMLGNVGMYLQW